MVSTAVVLPVAASKSARTAASVRQMTSIRQMTSMDMPKLYCDAVGTPLPEAQRKCPIVAPSSDAVPRPVGLLESEEDRVQRLHFADDKGLQACLATLTYMLLNNEEQTATSACLGRSLPVELQQWLKSHSIRLGRLLECYPQDFVLRKQYKKVLVRCRS
eukprot:TRINITY_DN19683_c0_g1_i4.p3 TRINITY_DN19683_c0_g1~~TRINITY_DN19683_c0_g1_i4.p3  ORF type:complete len:160 (+),score=28.75 TRINITY_DN19683_c0_g1_i4:138-617(+)